MPEAHISSANDLRGRLVGFEVLEWPGLCRHEYQVVAIGSIPRRAAALAAKECSSTLLLARDSLVGEGDGARRVARISEVRGAYPRTVPAAWAEVIGRRTALLPGLLDAWTSAVRATLNPANRLLVEPEPAGRLAAMPRAARSAYPTVVSPSEGLIPSGRFDPSGCRRLVDLRVVSGGLDPDVDVVGTPVPSADDCWLPVPGKNR
jgi:hypothetical protein